MMFFDSDVYPQLKLLEDNASAIRDEFMQYYKGRMQQWPDKSIYNHSWDVCPIYFYGNRNVPNYDAFPATSRVLDRIPHIQGGGFSRMGPGCHITPHSGYSNNLIRSHLGLFIPPDCALRCGSQTRTWEFGKAWAFDDSMEHEAWNRSKFDRIILIVDWLRDPNKQIWDGQVA
jgi:aspartyl/asparaginyl beta-hydroxylase (cupin superfamily)